MGILATYGALGLRHILGGVDHLMFVSALILLIRDRRRLVETVTALTLAHSLSLAAVTLGWVALPAAPVEAVIALSIMFPAAELLRPPGRDPGLSRRHPGMVAFLFGLLHGLGFARALADIGLPEGEIPVALLAFNLGVETGQVAFIAAVLVAGGLLARSVPRLAGVGRMQAGAGLRATGYLMGSIAAFWVVARLAAF